MILTSGTHIHYIVFIPFPFGDVPESVDTYPEYVIERCAGGSVVLPCLPQRGEGLAVEGVILKRQKGRGPVELLYNSKQHHSGSRSSSSSQFPVERVQLSSAPGPGGITYNLTLQQLQPEDSALYSCQLLLHGQPDSSTSLGRRVFFISVQGGSHHSESFSPGDFSWLVFAVQDERKTSFHTNCENF